MRRSPLLTTAVVLVSLTACAGGGDDEVAAEPIVAEDGAFTITGTDRLRWSTEEVSADTGELTVELVCEPAVNHNFVVDGETIAECGRGETDTGTTSLSDGAHEFVCTVPGHDRTMRGTITVG